MSTSERASRLDSVGRFAPALLALALVAALLIARLPLPWAGGLVLASLAAGWVMVQPPVGFVLIILAIPLRSLLSFQVGVASVGATEVLVWLVLASWLTRMVARRRVCVEVSYLGISLSVILAIMLFSLATAATLGPAVKEILKWVEILGLFLAVSHEIDGRWLRALVVSILLAGGAAAAHGIHQALLASGPDAFLLLGRYARAFGTFAQPNPYAGYLGLGAALAFGVVAGGYLTPGGWRRRLTWVALACGTGLLMLIAIVMSWSRGSWLGIIAALSTMVLAAALRAKGRFAAIGLAALVTAIVLLSLGLVRVPATLANRMAEAIPFLGVEDVRGAEVTDANYSVVERMAHWQAALDMWRDHLWLGVGVGNYASAYPGYSLPTWDDPLGHAHNFYLNMAAESGLPGLLAYSQLWAGGLVVAWIAVIRQRGLPAGAALGILGSLTYLAVHNLFDNLFVHGIYLEVAILLGAVTFLGRKDS